MHPSPLSLIINGVRKMVAETLVFSKMVVKTLIFGLQDDGQDGDFDDHDGVVDDNVLITWCYMCYMVKHMVNLIHGETQRQH